MPKVRLSREDMRYPDPVESTEPAQLAEHRGNVIISLLRTVWFDRGRLSYVLAHPRGRVEEAVRLKGGFLFSEEATPSSLSDLFSQSKMSGSTGLASRGTGYPLLAKDYRSLWNLSKREESGEGHEEWCLSGWFAPLDGSHCRASLVRVMMFKQGFFPHGIQGCWSG